MSLFLSSFASGSSGNSFLVKTEEGAIIIDAGISAKRILQGLAKAGVQPEEVRAVFITHEHSDHIRGIRVLMNRLKSADLFASKGTLAGIEKGCYIGERPPAERFQAMESGDIAGIAGMRVTPFDIFHDAQEPFGYRIERGEKTLGFLTDTGDFTEDTVRSLADADILVLESNHDPDMLKNGSYPHFLQKRILSRKGHLSNNQAAEMLLRLHEEDDRVRSVLLAHLSRENNTPAVAGHTVTSLLARKGLFSGRDYYLGCLERDTYSYIYRY